MNLSSIADLVAGVSICLKMPIVGNVGDYGCSSDDFIGRLLGMIINKCSKHRLLDQGKQVHGVVEKLWFGRDLNLNNNVIDMYAKCGSMDFSCKVPFVGNSMIDMYSKCGMVVEAAKVFNTLPVRNVISWNAMIAGYTHEGSGEMALNMFRKLQQNQEVPDRYKYSSSRIAEARRVFNRIEEKSVMSCNTLILGYAHENDLGEAMRLFRELRESRHMYMKCGLTDEADAVFREMLARDVVSWTAMIIGYRKHGMGNKAIELFNEMQVSGIEPDSVMYMAVLLA
ncbi:hypothetical protein Fmac_000885 [Flemingia macrophylla]|uniref:Pentatricopeptide repeat-containing protein n=1 Tax=Flemingia macrophylla TaxID=520843 RepID=A0ABD1NFI9_9FABA